MGRVCVYTTCTDRQNLISHLKSNMIQQKVIHICISRLCTTWKNYRWRERPGKEEERRTERKRYVHRLECLVREKTTGDRYCTIWSSGCMCFRHDSITCRCIHTASLQQYTGHVLHCWSDVEITCVTYFQCYCKITGTNHTRESFSRQQNQRKIPHLQYFPFMEGHIT